jgi:hypothetical protein
MSTIVRWIGYVIEIVAVPLLPPADAVTVILPVDVEAENRPVALTLPNVGFALDQVKAGWTANATIY